MPKVRSRRVIKRRRGYGRRRRGFRRMPIARVARMALRRSKGEKKYGSDTLNAQTVSWNGYLIKYFDNVPQGDQQNQRQGNNIYAHHITQRLIFDVAPSSVANVTWRIVGGIYLNANTTTTPTIVSLLSAAGTIRAPLSFFLTALNGRYKVKWDKVFTQCQITNPQVSKTIRFKVSKTLNYGANATTVPQNMGVFLMIINDVDSTEVGLPTITGLNKFYFFDK